MELDYEKLNHTVINMASSPYYDFLATDVNIKPMQRYFTWKIKLASHIEYNINIIKQFSKGSLYDTNNIDSNKTA